ncbi:MAG: ADP-glyceromanno-heptose 6-epimerase [Bacteroidales bacterium]|nr:ADP-glyceromanno-heptose 6-epimerase [Bacteroidales bacterium]
MIVVTGAAGFIGSNMVSKLNSEGYIDLILVDDFSNDEKNKNLENKNYSEKIQRDEFIKWADKNFKELDFIFHLGARTDTAEFDKSVFDKLNLNYSKSIWEICTRTRIPLLYASSAATYGMGEMGYDDKHEIVDKLKPLNPYGESKNEFDKWVLKQKQAPPFWAGMKFFNVYGPNEYHKDRMASVIFHAFNQIKETNKMQLFRSHNPGFKDGEQMRDFIYVKDVVDVLFFFLENEEPSGIYNLGTGKARTFLDLVKATFKAMGIGENIEFIDTPEDIRDKYQYFTEANMAKLLDTGYFIPFSSLEQGIDDYVKFFLLPGRYK